MHGRPARRSIRAARRGPPNIAARCTCSAANRSRAARALATCCSSGPAARWQALAPLPTPRNFARAVVLGDAVYVVGGSPTPGPSHASEGSAVVERYVGSCAARG